MRDENLAVVSGTVTAEPTFGATGGGVPVANVRVVAVTERDDGSSAAPQRDYFNCSYYAPDAPERFAGVAPGDRVCLVGRIRSRRSVGADGSSAYHATLVASAVSIESDGRKGEGDGTDGSGNGA